MDESEKIMKQVATKVNVTLRYYMENYTSVKRTPDSDKERCSSFEEYIECRFNREALAVPELHDGVMLTEGHLFRVTRLDEPNLCRRKFKLVKIELLDPNLLVDDTEDEDVLLKNEEIRKELEKIKLFLGGTVITFNGVKQKIKLNIENE